jgi:predicted ferric reductase
MFDLHDDELLLSERIALVFIIAVAIIGLIVAVEIIKVKGIRIRRYAAQIAPCRPAKD